VLGLLGLFVCLFGWLLFVYLFVVVDCRFGVFILDVKGGTKHIVICRNPEDTLISYFNMMEAVTGKILFSSVPSHTCDPQATRVPFIVTIDTIFKGNAAPSLHGAARMFSEVK